MVKSYCSKLSVKQRLCNKSFCQSIWGSVGAKIKDKTYESSKYFGYDKINGINTDNTKAMWYVLNDGTVVGIYIMVYIGYDGWEIKPDYPW